MWCDGKNFTGSDKYFKPQIGKATKAIEKKLEDKFSEIDTDSLDQVEDALEGIANQAGEAFGNIFPDFGGVA